MRFPYPSDKRLNDGRRFSWQRKPRRPTRKLPRRPSNPDPFSIFVPKGAAINRGAFFFVDGPEEPAGHLHLPVEPADAEILFFARMMANTGSLRRKFRSFAGWGFKSQC